jgi:hypothetical protein
MHSGLSGFDHPKIVHDEADCESEEGRKTFRICAFVLTGAWGSAIAGANATHAMRNSRKGMRVI